MSGYILESKQCGNIESISVYRIVLLAQFQRAFLWAAGNSGTLNTLLIVANNIRHDG